VIDSGGAVLVRRASQRTRDTFNPLAVKSSTLTSSAVNADINAQPSKVRAQPDNAIAISRTHIEAERELERHGVALPRQPAWRQSHTRSLATCRYGDHACTAMC
jgi:hypothetical protein